MGKSMGSEGGFLGSVDWRSVGRTGAAVGLALLFVAFVSMAVQADAPVIIVSLVLGVIGIALWPMLALSDFTEWMQGRQARYGGNTALVTVAFIGILVVGYVLIDRASLTWDLTATGKYTLSDESREVIENVVVDGGNPIHIVGFYSSQRYRQRENVELLLKRYEEAGQGLITYEFIDPDEEPTVANLYGMEYDGMVYVQRRDADPEDAIPVRNPDEQGITSAILQVTIPETFMVYFVTNHGEARYEQTGNDGMSWMSDLLGSMGVQFEELNLLAAPEVPEDASMLVIAGPRLPFTPEEVAKLEAYLDNGGRLLIMTPDPWINEDDDPFAPDSPLEEMLEERFGVRVRRDLIIDGKSNAGDPSWPVPVRSSSTHGVTRQLMGAPVVFFFSRSIERMDDAPAGPVRLGLLFTSPDAWGETDLEALLSGEYQYDERHDAREDNGLQMAMAIEDSTVGERAARIVLVGDADFATNEHYDVVPGNWRFILGAFDWLTEFVESVTLPPTFDESEQPIFATSQQQNIIQWVTMIIIPFSTLAIGAVVWWNRRRR